VQTLERKVQIGKNIFIFSYFSQTKLGVDTLGHSCSTQRQESRGNLWSSVW